MHQEPPGKAGAAASEYDPAACETWIFARLFEALRAGLPQSDAARSDLQVQQADALSLLRRASALFDVGEDALAPYALFACPAFMLSTEEAGVAALRTAYPIEEWDEAGSLRQMISSFLSADLVDMSWILDTWREAILQDFSASMQTTLERVLPLGPKLGKGAYGTVHLVQRAGRLFAVKTSRCSSLFDQRAQRLLAKNPHKHIVKQASPPLRSLLCDARGRPLAVEFMEALVWTSHGSLSSLPAQPVVYTADFDRMEAKFAAARRLGADEAALHAAAQRWLEEVCSAVAHMHSLGVAHRDLKPGNIMLQQNGTAVVCDLGLAATNTEHNEGWGGTPRYMAPEACLKCLHREQSVSDDTVSDWLPSAPSVLPRDVWSLAVMLARDWLPALTKDHGHRFVETLFVRVNDIQEWMMDTSRKKGPVVLNALEKFQQESARKANAAAHHLRGLSSSIATECRASAARCASLARLFQAYAMGAEPKQNKRATVPELLDTLFPSPVSVGGAHGGEPQWRTPPFTVSAIPAIRGPMLWSKEDLRYWAVLQDVCDRHSTEPRAAGHAAHEAIQSTLMNATFRNAKLLEPGVLLSWVQACHLGEGGESCALVYLVTLLNGAGAALDLTQAAHACVATHRAVEVLQCAGVPVDQLALTCLERHPGLRTAVEQLKAVGGLSVTVFTELQKDPDLCAAVNVLLGARLEHYRWRRPDWKVVYALLKQEGVATCIAKHQSGDAGVRSCWLWAYVMKQEPDLNALTTLLLLEKHKNLAKAMEVLVPEVVPEDATWGPGVFRLLHDAVLMCERLKTASRSGSGSGSGSAVVPGPDVFSWDDCFLARVAWIANVGLDPTGGKEAMKMLTDLAYMQRYLTETASSENDHAKRRQPVLACARRILEAPGPLLYEGQRSQEAGWAASRSIFRRPTTCTKYAQNAQNDHVLHSLAPDSSLDAGAVPDAAGSGPQFGAQPGALGRC